MTTPTKRYSRYFTYIAPVAKHPIIRNYGTTIFTLTMMAIFILFAIKPTIETILVLQKELEDSKEVLVKVSQKSEDLSLAKKNYDQLDPSVKAKIQTLVPDRVELKTVIQNLELTARAYEASISALQIQPLSINPESPDILSNKLDEVSFTFNVEGTYPNLVELLESLKSSPRHISIDSLIFNKSGGSQTLLMSVSGKAYYLK